jgi:hypothetical protein
MTDFMCQALDFHGHTYCSRCRLDWPTGVACSPQCKPKADPPIGLVTMYEGLTSQANRIIDSQQALIAAKARITPDEGEMRRRAVLMAAAQLIERVYRDERIMGLLKGAAK